MKGRKGFTLIELLVVFCIIGVFVALIFGAVGGCRSGGYYSTEQTGVFQCVKTYTYTTGGEGVDTSKRVDMRPEGGGSVETFVCDDDMIIGVYNSARLYAQFEAGKWYRVTTVGTRREGWYSYYPTVTAVVETPDPTK